MGGWLIDVGGTLSITDVRREPLELRPKERAILAAITLLHPQPAPVDDVIELVWDTPPPTARKAVHNHVARVRRHANGLVDTSPAGYLLGGSVEIEPPHTDDVFRDLLDHPHVAIARTRFREARLSTEESDAAAGLGRRPDPATVDRLIDLAAAEPHRPVRWRIAAVALARSGRRRFALDQLRQARQRSVGDMAELNLLRRLERAVLDDDPILDVNGPLLLPADSLDDERPTERGSSGSATGDSDGLFIDAGGILGRIAAPIHESSGGCIVLSGPAGAGKTTLCAQLRDLAGERGWETHHVVTRSHGSADTDLVTALERSLAERHASPMRLDRRRLVRPADRAVERLVADDRRRLVIVDDVHHATTDELIAVTELVRRTQDVARVLWVVASRTPPDIPGADHVPVTAWDTAAIEHLLHRFVPPTAWTAGAAAWISTQSGGIALAVRELVLNLVHRRAATTDPDGEFAAPTAGDDPVEWVRRRVDQLDPATRQALTGVAMIGVEFRLRSLEAFAADASAVIAAARLDGIVAPVDDVDGRLRFTHDLFRDVLLDELDDDTRSSLALLALRDPMFDDDTESRRRAMLARIAATDDPARAIAETIAAAQLEEERHHPVEAERLYRRAFELIERHDDRDDPRWLDAAMRLGSVAISNGSSDATEILFDATDRAITARRADLAATMLREVARVGPGSTVGRSETRVAAAVERVRSLPTTPTDDVQLDMAEMAVFGMGTDSGRARAILDRAMATAEGTGDPTLIAMVERTAYAATSRPADLPFRRELTDRVLRHGEELGDVTLTYEGLRLAFCVAVEAGDTDPRGLMEQMATLHERFNERSRNWSLFAFRCTIAWLDGDTDEVQRWIDRLLSPETVVSPELKMSTAGGHLLGLHLLRDDLASLDPFVAQLERDIPELRAWTAARAATAAAAGDHATAAARLANARLGDGRGAGFDLADDFTAVPSAFLLGEAAASIGDTDSLEIALEVLQPWSGQWLWHGTGTFGPVDLAVARWMRQLGDEPDAVRTLAQQALRSATIVGSPHVVAAAAQLVAASASPDDPAPRTPADRVAVGP